MATIPADTRRASRRAAASRLGTIVKAVREAPQAAVVILGGLMLVAIFADFIAPHDPTLPVQGAGGFAPPFWMEGGRVTTLLGTDLQGRYVLSRLTYAGLVSLVGGRVGTLGAGRIGTAGRIISRYRCGFVDQ